jgi:hypothetical protein
MNANATVTESSQYLTSPQRALADASCKRCGTDLKLGAEFCHVCGRWVFGSNLSRLMKATHAALSQLGIELPVLICMGTAAVFAVISMFVGIRIDPKTIGEWQVIQYWRIEWLLGAIMMLLFGVLLRKSR